MPLLESLTIKNFRGFDALEIDGLSKINIFLGKNNSGKTSVLESLFLLLGMSNPMLPKVVNQFRGFNSGAATQLNYLFHNLKAENKPSFYGKFSDQSERWLELEAQYQDNPEPILSDGTGISISMPAINGVDLNFSIKKIQDPKKTYKSSLLYENKALSYKLSGDYTEELQALFVSSDKNDSSVLARYSEIVKRKEGDFILNSLRQFDDNIIGIQALPDGLYFDVKGFDELTSISMMGDGVKQFLSVITAVAAKKDSFVLIDEIENGLHHSKLKLLWRCALSLAERYNSQLFIVTHDMEIISRLVEVLGEKEYTFMQDFVEKFTIAKTLSKGYKSYRLSFEGLQDAVDLKHELRY
ncbi:recombination protein F [Bacteroidales bacterium Barb6]|nr:recombination protein F [Bacteroidales bacterium Barb6]